MSRKPFVGGNWKMNGSSESIIALVAGLNEQVDTSSTDVVVAPVSLYLSTVVGSITPNIEVAGQNCYFEEKGAFTGEVSATQLVDVGAKWVLIGHSERRHVFGEVDDVLAKKLHAAVKSGLKVVFCVGETLQQREANETQHVVCKQLDAALRVLCADDWNKVVLAYEPVWAIGTGKTASPEQAQEVHAVLRAHLNSQIGNVADSVRIVYGGSVKPTNAETLFKNPDIDGFLVGGASLRSADFSAIVKATK